MYYAPQPMRRTANAMRWLFLALVILHGCAAQPRRSPLSIPLAEFKATCTTICLNELRLPAEVADMELKQAEFERLLTDQLRSAQIAVVPSAATLATWDTVSRAHGGAFDPHSGRYDDTKGLQIRRTAMKELGCQAKLSPSVVAVTAPWANGVARWDGVQDYLEGGSDAHGQVGAFSLWVSIRDVDDRELFFNTGGIQVVAKLRGRAPDQQFVDVDTDELLSDPERNGDAVATALEDLGGQTLKARLEQRATK